MVIQSSGLLMQVLRGVALGSIVFVGVGCATESATSRGLFVATAGELEAASPATFSAERGSTQTSSRVALGSHREQVRLLAEGYLRATVTADVNVIAAMFAGRPVATDSGQPSRSPEDIVEHHRTVATNSAMVDGLRSAIERNDPLISVRSFQEFRRQSAAAMPWLQQGDWIVNLNYASLSPTMPPYSLQLFTVLVVRWTSSAPKVVGVSSLGPLRR